MVTLLHALGYAAAIAAFLFVTLSLASGLLWLSEVIEEHSRAAKTAGLRTIYGVMVIHVLLWLFDGLPLLHISFSIFCHGVYLTNFTPTWPLISLSSPSFIGSCILVLTDHFVWFFYFSHRTQVARRRGGRGPPRYDTYDDTLSFMDIATFFAVCVWLVPLFLFLSLSANDNALPTAGNASVPGTPVGLGLNLDAPGSHFQHLQSTPPTIARTSLFHQILDPVISILPFRSRRRRDEGIIAPRTPGPIPPASPSTSRRSSWNSGHPQYNAFQNEAARRSPMSAMANPPPPRRATSESVSPIKSRVPLASASGRNGSGGGSRVSLGKRVVHAELEPDVFRSSSPDTLSDSGRF